MSFVVWFMENLPVRVPFVSGTQGINHQETQDMCVVQYMILECSAQVREILPQK